MAEAATNQPHTASQLAKSLGARRGPASLARSTQFQSKVTATHTPDARALGAGDRDSQANEEQTEENQEVAGGRITHMVSWRLTWAWPAPSRCSPQVAVPRAAPPHHRPRAAPSAARRRPARRRRTARRCQARFFAPTRERERATPSVFFSTDDKENEEIRGNLVFCLCV